MLRVGGLVALCLMLLALPAQAQRDRTEELVLLGQKSVGFLVDRDVIEVGRSEDWFRNRAFRTLHFAAERNDLHLISIRLVYLNGYHEDLVVDRTIRAGRQLPVDLRGERSYLQRIEMVYRSRPSFRGQAVIKVYGEPAPRPRRPAPFEPDESWLLLGEKSVGFGVDRDVINLSRSEDWFRDRGFSMLHLVAEGGDVHMLSIRIVYFNGYAEDIKIDKLISAGGHVSVDLRGERSYLRRIEMVYRSRPSFRGLAVIKVYGEPARRPIRPIRFEPPKDWELLGEKSVGFRVDRDIITVSRPENWFRDRGFRTLHFVAEDNDVHLLSIRIVYFNGFAETIKIGEEIREGRSLPVDLRGERSYLRRIEMTYRAEPNRRGEAVVKVYGEPARGGRR